MVHSLSNELTKHPPQSEVRTETAEKNCIQSAARDETSEDPGSSKRCRRPTSKKQELTQCPLARCIHVEVEKRFSMGFFQLEDVYLHSLPQLPGRDQENLLCIASFAPFTTCVVLEGKNHDMKLTAQARLRYAATNHVEMMSQLTHTLSFGQRQILVWFLCIR